MRWWHIVTVCLFSHTLAQYEAPPEEAPLGKPLKISGDANMHKAQEELHGAQSDEYARPDATGPLPESSEGAASPAPASAPGSQESGYHGSSAAAAPGTSTKDETNETSGEMGNGKAAQKDGEYEIKPSGNTEGSSAGAAPGAAESAGEEKPSTEDNYSGAAPAGDAALPGPDSTQSGSNSASPSAPSPSETTSASSSADVASSGSSAPSSSDKYSAPTSSGGSSASASAETASSGALSSKVDTDHPSSAESAPSAGAESGTAPSSESPAVQSGGDAYAAPPSGVVESAASGEAASVSLISTTSAPSESGTAESIAPSGSSSAASENAYSGGEVDKKGSADGAGPETTTPLASSEVVTVAIKPSSSGEDKYSAGGVKPDESSASSAAAGGADASKESGETATPNAPSSGAVGSEASPKAEEAYSKPKENGPASALSGADSSASATSEAPKETGTSVAETTTIGASDEHKEPASGDDAYSGAALSSESAATPSEDKPAEKEGGATGTSANGGDSKKDEYARKGTEETPDATGSVASAADGSKSEETASPAANVAESISAPAAATEAGPISSEPAPIDENDKSAAKSTEEDKIAPEVPSTACKPEDKKKEGASADSTGDASKGDGYAGNAASLAAGGSEKSKETPVEGSGSHEVEGSGDGQQTIEGSGSAPGEDKYSKPSGSTSVEGSGSDEGNALSPPADNSVTPLPDGVSRNPPSAPTSAEIEAATLPPYPKSGESSSNSVEAGDKYASKESSSEGSGSSESSGGKSGEEVKTEEEGSGDEQGKPEGPAEMKAIPSDAYKKPNIGKASEDAEKKEPNEGTAETKSDGASYAEGSKHVEGNKAPQHIRKGRSTDGIDAENLDEEESTDGDYIIDDVTNSPDEAFVTIAQTTETPITTTSMKAVTTPKVPRAKAPQIEGDVSPFGTSKPDKLEKQEEERVRKEDEDVAKPTLKTRGTRIIKKKVEDVTSAAEKIVLHEVDEMTEDEDPESVELTSIDASTGGGMGLRGKIRKIEKDGKSRISTIDAKLGPILEESAEVDEHEKKAKTVQKSVPKVQTKTKTQRIPMRMTMRKSAAKKEDSEMKSESSEEVEEKKKLSLVVRKIEKPMKHTIKKITTTMKPLETTEKMKEDEKVVEKAESAEEPLETEKKTEREEQAAILDAGEESSEKELETEKQKKIEAKRKEMMEHSREMKIHRVEKMQKKSKIEEKERKYEKIVAADSEERVKDTHKEMEKMQVQKPKPKAQNPMMKLKTIKENEEIKEMTTTSEPQEDEAIVGVESEEKTVKEEELSKELESGSESNESPEKRKHEEAVDDTISLVGPPEDEKSGEEELKKVEVPSVTTTSIPTIETTLEVLSAVEKEAAGLTTTEAGVTPITITTTIETTETVMHVNTTTQHPTPRSTTDLQILKTHLEILKNETSTETTDHRGVRLIKTSSGSIIEMAPRGTRRVIKKKKSGPVIIIKPKNEVAPQTSSEEVNRRTKKVKKVHKLKRVRVVHRNRNIPAAKDLPTEERIPHLDEQKELVKKVDKEKKIVEETKDKFSESEEKEKKTEEVTKTTDWQYVTAPGERTAAPGVTLPPEASKLEDGETLIQEATDWDTFTSTQPGVVEELKRENEDSDYNEILGLTTLTTFASTTNQLSVTNKRIIDTPVEPSGYDMRTEPVIITSPELPPTKPEEAVGYDGIAKEEFRDAPAPKQDVLVNTDVKTVVKQEQERSADETKRGWIPYRFDCESEEDDKGPLCKEWALGGLCEQHKPTMFLFCRKTCLCTGPLARRRRNIQL